jgi:hypothetical protein
MEDKWYERFGHEPPSRTSHGLTPEELRSKLQSINPRNWRLKGNQLIADTDMGPLINYIDPSYILKGFDKKGLPILQKLDINESRAPSGSNKNVESNTKESPPPGHKRGKRERTIWQTTPTPTLRSRK